jgi:hypothetical protein
MGHVAHVIFDTSNVTVLGAAHAGLANTNSATVAVNNVFIVTSRP